MPFFLYSFLLFTFVVLGVGSESAFAQRLGKVQKKSPVKKGVEELPRIMDDPPTPPIYVTPPAEVIGDRPYQPGGGGGIWFPSPVQQPQPGHSDPGNLPGGGGGSGGGSGSTGTPPPQAPPIDDGKSCDFSCTCQYYSGITYSPGACPQYGYREVTLTKSFSFKGSKCDDMTESKACSGSSGYTGYTIQLYNITCKSSCGNAYSRILQNGQGGTDDPPHSYGSIAVGTSCNGNPLTQPKPPITDCSE